MVISEAFANRYFGRSDVIGRTVTWRDSLKLHVTGVMENLDNAIFKKADMIVNFYNQRYGNWASTDEAFAQGVFNMVGCNVFLLMYSGKTFIGREKELRKCYGGFWYVFDESKEETLYSTPVVERFNDIYFSDSEKMSALRSGNRTLVNILGAVALVILFFAITNYINLTVAQSDKRSREMAARRLFGASRSAIALRFVEESLLLCAIALVLSMLLTVACAPLFGQLLDTTINLRILLSWPVVVLLVSLLVLVGVVSGIIPAIVASRVQPIEIVRGAFVHKTKMVFSRVFIVMQNVVTITMLACSLAMFMQMRHLVHAPMGFRQKALLVVEDMIMTQNWRNFVEEAQRLPCVKNVALSLGTPIDGGNNSTFVKQKGLAAMSVQYLVVEPSFFDIYDIKLVNGTKPMPGYYYMNRKMVNDLKNSSSIGDPRKMLQVLTFYGVPKDCQYGGELKDFHIRNIQEEPHCMFICVKDKVDYPWQITLEMDGDLQKAYDEVAKVYYKVFREEMTGEVARYADRLIQDVFEEQVRTSRIVSLFALMAILISLLGLVAMSTYFIQQRQKEIAIRKIFGSTTSQMGISLVRTFLGNVLVAWVISIPVIWHFIGRWMSQFTYRSSWWPWMMVSGFVVLLVSLVAVAVQSYHAANENPVRHVKDND